MAESTLDPTGKPVDLAQAEQEFARAMSTPKAADTSTDNAPPKRQPRDETAEPAKKRGRPAKADAKPKPAPKAATPEVTAARSQSVVDTLSVVSTAAVTFGKTLKNDALKADGYVAAHFAKPIGDACAELAKHEPSFAAMLDKQASGKAMAYVGLITIASQMGVQLAVNHGAFKPGLMGSASRDDVIRAFESADDPTTAGDEGPEPGE